MKPKFNYFNADLGLERICLRDLASYTALNGNYHFLLLKATQKPDATTVILDRREGVT